jgi:hypothetical protein
MAMQWQQPPPPLPPPTRRAWLPAAIIGAAIVAAGGLVAAAVILTDDGTPAGARTTCQAWTSTRDTLRAIPALPTRFRAVSAKGRPALREKLGKPMRSLAEKQHALDP